MSKKRYGRIDRVVIVYIVLSIGLIIFASGWIYMISTGGVRVVQRPYVVSIPRRYFGELQLSPPGEQRLNIETVFEVQNLTVRGGIPENATTFHIANRSYVLTTIKVKGRTLDGSTISLIVQVYSADNNELVGSGSIMNKSSIVDGEYIVSTSLESGRYLLKILSNSDSYIEYLAMRGIYYDQLANPALSITFTPEEFYHHTLYYVDKIDLRDLWISIAVMVSGLTLMQVSLVVVLLVPKVYGMETPIKAKRR